MVQDLEAPIHQSHVCWRSKFWEHFLRSHQRNLSAKLYQNLTSTLREKHLFRISSCLYSACSQSPPPPPSPPIHRPCLYKDYNFTNIFWKKGHPRNIPVKLLQTRSFREDDFFRILSYPHAASSPHSLELCLLKDKNFRNKLWKGSSKKHS